MPTVSIKGGIVGLAGRASEFHPALSTANLASGEMKAVVDDEGDISSSQGGCCCPGKSSREGGKKTRRNNVAVDKRKMATDGGENEKNVQGW